ncbi:phosphatase [Xanthocytophaga agilis]|uniref:Phosphatase n=1 Tax=Xanthocytophaga agilis TaxID=3048010 RepID=A0AAE3UB81_9BACT|nr:phosphatase [Xanthocytophaga agilis]MDJ1499528.1 phosphatase [Xanthocytophaga agilis]
MNRVAVIDLGTNTFHLLVADISEDRKIIPVHEQKQPARIGKGGISQGIIAPEAFDRGLSIITTYAHKIADLNVSKDNIFATGTSAIRNARNGEEFVQKIREATGIQVEIISGDREAELIYHGVRAALEMEEKPSLIIDIGGGSVEFIIGNADKIYWKQSFEIGGQRLMDKFMQTDPISPQSVQRMYDFLNEKLLPLTNAIHQYHPKTLIGSSGTFDTLVEIQALRDCKSFSLTDHTSYDLPIEVFQSLFQEFVSKNHEERLAIPGMIPLRVDMIVVACCLVDFVLKKYEIHQIKTSTYALKEGVLFDHLK